MNHALRHLLLFLGYAVPALVLALTLPHWLPAVDRGLVLAAGVGVVALSAGGLLHEVRLRARRDGALGEQLLELRQAVYQIQEELTWARRESLALGEALEALARRGRAGQGARAVEEVMAEVKALKSLVEQVSGGAFGRAKAPLAVAAGGAAPGLAELARPAKPKRAPLMLVPLPRKLDENAVLETVERALRDDRVELVLQPIVSLPPRKHCFYECFSRIRNNDGSLVLPDDYLAVAEREGHITAIDNMLLLRCIQLVRVVRRQKERLGFFCNVSSHTLRDQDFFSDFLDFLELNEELAPNLIFEAAQADFLAQGVVEAAHLGRLATLGCRFSIDQVTDLDFDAAALAMRRIRFVKVEAEVLLAEAAVDQRSPGNLKRRLAAQGIDLIVEKIETEATLLELLDQEIEFGQGYLFGEPRPARQGEQGS